MFTFGPANREVFSDRLIIAVVKEVLRELSKEVSADDFGNILRDTYNLRQMEYSVYKDLIPAKEQPLKGTLCWEFSKVLFSFLNDTNPATLMAINMFVASMAQVMLNDAMPMIPCRETPASEDTI